MQKVELFFFDDEICFFFACQDNVEFSIFRTKLKMEDTISLKIPVNFLFGSTTRLSSEKMYFQRDPFTRTAKRGKYSFSA